MAEDIRATNHADVVSSLHRENERLMRQVEQLRKALLSKNGGIDACVQKQNVYHEGVKLLFKHSQELICVLDMNANYMYGSLPFVKWLNICQGELAEGLTGRDIFSRLFEPDVCEYMIADVRAAIHDGRRIEWDNVIVAGDAKFPRDYRVNITPLPTQEGEMLGAAVHFRDITELLKAMADAEKSSNAKTEFLSTMSHEMRTPMNAIIGMAHMARSASEIEKKDYCLKKIDDASKHLLSIINDVLDMSKIEAGKLQLCYGEFNFEKMLMNVTNFVVLRIEEKKQFFNISVDQNVPLFLVSDEQRLTQVLVNLLSNAVKFTPEEGKIDLVIKTIAEMGNSCVLQIEVQDSGIGISKEQQKRLFKSFQQVDEGISRKYGGTGLGLAISQRIIEMMDGTIRVESEVGKGSKFILTVCVQVGTSESKAEAPAQIEWEKIRVLVVDDSAYIRSYFKNISHVIGFECDVAEGADEARGLVEDERRAVYDVVFVDYIMPGLSGIELTRMLRKRGCENAVVIMMSTADWEQMEAEARGAGVDRFLYKPLFTSTIMECLKECLDANAESVRLRDEQKRNIHSFSDKRVLIVEDIEINREILMVLLEPTGVQMECAVNGAQAAEMVANDPGRYDLVLMDIQMPEMDGLTATRKIRALDSEKARTVPIIAMTANVFADDVTRCLDAGMNDHLGKPVDAGQMMEKLKMYIG